MEGIKMERKELFRLTFFRGTIFFAKAKVVAQEYVSSATILALQEELNFIWLFGLRSGASFLFFFLFTHNLTTSFIFNEDKYQKDSLNNNEKPNDRIGNNIAFNSFHFTKDKFFFFLNKPDIKGFFLSICRKDFFINPIYPLVIANIPRGFKIFNSSNFSYFVKDKNGKEYIDRQKQIAISGHIGNAFYKEQASGEKGKVNPKKIPKLFKGKSVIFCSHIFICGFSVLINFLKKFVGFHYISPLKIYTGGGLPINFFTLYLILPLKPSFNLYKGIYISDFKKFSEKKNNLGYEFSINIKTFDNSMLSDGTEPFANTKTKPKGDN
jgi:hypothetical protein